VSLKDYRERFVDRDADDRRRAVVTKLKATRVGRSDQTTTLGSASRAPRSVVIVLDASVALKWFVDDEPLVDEARTVLDDIGRQPAEYLVPELFMNELLAVLSRLPDATTGQVREALTLVETLGMARVANGHDLLQVDSLN